MFSRSFFSLNLIQSLLFPRFPAPHIFLFRKNVFDVARDFHQNQTISEKNEAKAHPESEFLRNKKAEKIELNYIASSDRQFSCYGPWFFNEKN